MTEYYGGIQIYSKFCNLIASEIAEFIKTNDFSPIFGIKESIDKLKKELPEFSEEIGTVGELTTLKVQPNNNVYSATLKELDEIVQFVSQDENIGKPYGFQSLYNQYYDRKKNNFGRNFILRDRNNGEIICHAGTYAEISELAVIGGVITSPNYRRKGFSKETLASLCQQLQNENKRIFSYYYIPSAINMHSSVGFEKIGDWVKLIK